MKETPILIVGAGPTGLVLALWLAKSGVPFRIIDKADAPGQTSRAMAIQARTLEFYRQLGFDQAVLERGMNFTEAHLWVRGNEVAKIPFGDSGQAISRFPYAVIFPQDLHEELLNEQLGLLSIAVERQTELIDLAITPDGVDATLRLGTGEHETTRYRYIAGCDGARSKVREKLGTGFPGGTYNATFYVADIEGSGPTINGQMNGALDEADFIAIFPMKGQGRARLVGSMQAELSDKKDLSWEDVSKTVMNHLKMQVDKVNWFSFYRVHHRVASSFRKGPVFLLGDAAHIHSPVGGQGMNTGIGDAVNLAWKLASVVKNGAPEILLDTYEPERIAFAQRLVATTDRAFTFVTSRGNFARFVRLNIVPWLLPMLFQLKAVRRYFYTVLSQTLICYPHSALSVAEANVEGAGNRLKWLRYRGETGSEVDNFHCLSNLQWQVHTYGFTCPILKVLCDQRGLEYHAFERTPAATAAGMGKDATYIIRPDGYIGLAAARVDAETISAYLDKWLPATH